MGQPLPIFDTLTDLRRGASAQQRVMEAIRRSFRRLGGAPSLTELSIEAGVRRTDVVRVLRTLQHDGMIRLQPGIARGIEMIDRTEMLSDHELELAMLKRGYSVHRPAQAVAPLADLLQPVTDTNCELPLDALLAQVDAVDEARGQQHGAEAGKHEDQADGGPARRAG